MQRHHRWNAFLPPILKESSTLELTMSRKLGTNVSDGTVRLHTNTPRAHWVTREITAGELTTKSGPGATQPIPIHDGITVTSLPASESPSFGNDFLGVYFTCRNHCIHIFTVEMHIKNFKQLFCLLLFFLLFYSTSSFF